MTCQVFTPEMLNMGFVYGAMAIGIASSAIMISIVYMIGKITGNPRLDVWAHDELPQLFFSALFATFILGFLNLGTMYKASALSALTNFTVQNGDMCIYDYADAYLDDMSVYVHNTMRITRIYNSMAGFISAIWKYDCKSVWCFLAGQELACTRMHGFPSSLLFSTPRRTQQRLPFSAFLLRNTFSAHF